MVILARSRDVLFYPHSQLWEVSRYQMSGHLLGPSPPSAPVVTHVCAPDAPCIIIHRSLVEQRTRHVPTHLPVLSASIAPYCHCQQACHLPTSTCPLTHHNRKSL